MEEFVEYASVILAEEKNGLTGSQITKKFVDYAVKFNKKIKYNRQPFMEKGKNISKKKAFAENLNCFSNEEKFFIIDDMCRDDKFIDNNGVKELMVKLHQNYKQYDKIPRENENLNIELIEETKHWLDHYPNAKKQFDEALNNYELGISDRNVLDGMRLSLEILLREVLGNDKSLENQRSDIGKFLKNFNTSNEFRNMFQKLIDYYSTYQNECVKHNDKVNILEIEFVIEITTIFMKNIVKLKFR